MQRTVQLNKAGAAAPLAQPFSGVRALSHKAQVQGKAAKAARPAQRGQRLAVAAISTNGAKPTASEPSAAKPMDIVSAPGPRGGQDQPMRPHR